MKHVYRVGDKSKSICCYCGIIVETTLLIHPNDDKRMAFFCDECGTITSYPPFGTPVKEKDERWKKNIKLKVVQS